MPEFIVTVTERVTNDATIRVIAKNQFDAMRYAGDLYNNHELKMERRTSPDVFIDAKESTGDQIDLPIYSAIDKQDG